MFSADDIAKIEKAMAKFGSNKKTGGKCGKNPGNGDNPEEPSCFNLNPSQLLVIAGLLSGVFEVNSILVSKEQVVEIVLAGSLKRKTPMEEFIKQIGQMPFDEVMKALLGM